EVELRFVGGLLGHWSVWTHSVVKLYEELREYRDGRDIPAELLTRGAAVTDCNGVFFDVAHNFAGCIPGVHEVLRRQGLMAGTWCL
ncbi:dihydrodipicolinate synthase family protein, partial [Ruthenibacterium lactatiformans]|nr:dihydrodipicolinate synthase family protein [Ruthenibacterium lactatiformans]